ncbi:MAG: type II toxin-antitoxin system RelE/ParE family toxin [Sphingomonadaceae bacterium]|nr:MAG: type II toxin-antitoxin system RelE/ParE family toxin [Sphingomonadaceae bacterium]
MRGSHRASSTASRRMCFARSSRRSPTRMGKLRISTAAVQDLRQIRANGIRDYGIAASSSYMDGFERLFRVLSGSPRAGTPRPEFEPGNVRSLSYRPHRILYRVIGDDVVIDRIIHQARDVRRALRDKH